MNTILEEKNVENNKKLQCSKLKHTRKHTLHYKRKVRQHRAHTCNSNAISLTASQNCTKDTIIII